MRRVLEERGGLSETEANDAIARGAVFVDARRADAPELKIAVGARVRVHFERARSDAARGLEVTAVALPTTPSESAPALHLRARILFLDDAAIFADKPAGLAAQTPLEGGAALPDYVATLIGGPALLVHRLDRDTTGVTVLARTTEAQRQLQRAFREGAARKEYLALIAGCPPEERWTVDAPLGADPDAPRRSVRKTGSPAITDFEIVERFDRAGVALLLCRPRTGRTHQIRAHAAHAGYPLLGDAKYGGPRQITLPDGTRLPAPRPFLHAARLRLPPAYDVAAPLPEDMKSILAKLRSV